MTIKLLILAAGTLALSAPALAQNGTVPPPAAATPAAPDKSAMDAEISAVTQMLSGCWKATVAGSGDVVMGVAPVTLADGRRALYSELSLATAMNRPFRQTLWLIERGPGGQLSLKTHEFLSKPEHAVGLWTAPDMFPPVTMDQLTPSVALNISKLGEGFTGVTPAPYPTTVAKAASMTSQITFNGEWFTTTDRGYDAEGKLVWGPAEGQEGYTFRRFNDGPKVSRLKDGLTVIEYPAPVEGEPAKPGERVMVHYMGYLDSGKMFDSSFQRGSPFTYTKGDKLIEGWNQAMADARKGTTRRVVIPATLAHGADTNNGKVPSNATLIYDVKVVNVLAAGAPVPTAAVPGAPTIRTAPGAVQPKLEPVNPNDPRFLKAKADMEARMEAKRKQREEQLRKEQEAKEKADKEGKPAEPAKP